MGQDRAGEGRRRIRLTAQCEKVGHLHWDRNEQEHKNEKYE